MKILLYNDVYDEIGGIITYYKLLPHYLRELGHEVYIFSFAKERIGDYIHKKPKTNIFFRFFSSFIFNFRIYNLFKECFKEIKPDIIHINHNLFYTNSILLAIKKSKIPALQSLHDYSFICPKGWCVNKKWNECEGGFGLKCLKCVPFIHFIAYSLFYPLKVNFSKKVIKYYTTFSKRYIKKLKNNSFKNVFYTPYFVDFSLKKRIKNIKKEKNLILFVGRLREEKGAQYLISAMPKIIKKNSKAKLVIIGDGPLEGYLKKRAKELGVEHKVKFKGSVPFKEIHKFYKKATIIVVPSIWTEQFGKVGIEAMYYRTPAVGSKVGGIPEWLRDKKNGFLVEPRNSNQIAQKVIEILENKKLAKRFGKYGLEMVLKNFSSDKHMKKLEEIYKFVIKKYEKDTFN